MNTYMYVHILLLITITNKAKKATGEWRCEMEKNVREKKSATEMLVFKNKALPDLLK